MSFNGLHKLEYLNPTMKRDFKCMVINLCHHLTPTFWGRERG